MTIRFETNKPVEVRLRSLEGKPVDSKFGGIQRMFTAEEGAFYVSEAVAVILGEQFRKLGVQRGEAIDICKAEVRQQNGGTKIQWQVAKVGFAVGEQADGTFVVATPQPPSELEQQLKASIEMAEARKQTERALAAAPGPDWQRHLIAQTCALVDAYAAVVKHAAKHEGMVKTDDVRSIFLSAFINVAKGGANTRAA